MNLVWSCDLVWSDTVQVCGLSFFAVNFVLACLFWGFWVIVSYFLCGWIVISVGEASMLRSCVVPWSAIYGFSGLFSKGLGSMCSIAAGLWVVDGQIFLFCRLLGLSSLGFFFEGAGVSLFVCLFHGGTVLRNWLLTPIIQSCVAFSFNLVSNIDVLFLSWSFVFLACLWISYHFLVIVSFRGLLLWPTLVSGWYILSRWLLVPEVWCLASFLCKTLFDLILIYQMKKTFN